MMRLSAVWLACALAASAARATPSPARVLIAGSDSTDAVVIKAVPVTAAAPATLALPTLPDGQGPPSPLDSVPGAEPGTIVALMQANTAYAAAPEGLWTWAPSRGWQRQVAPAQLNADFSLVTDGRYFWGFGASPQNAFKSVVQVITPADSVITQPVAVETTDGFESATAAAGRAYLVSYDPNATAPGAIVLEIGRAGHTLAKRRLPDCDTQGGWVPIVDSTAQHVYVACDYPGQPGELYRLAAAGLAIQAERTFATAEPDDLALVDATLYLTDDGADALLRLNPQTLATQAPAVPGLDGILIASGDQSRLYLDCPYCLQLTQYAPASGTVADFGPALPVSRTWYPYLLTHGPLDLANEDLSTGAGQPVQGSGLSTVPPASCNPIRYQVLSAPADGTVATSASGFTYTPASGFAGRDVFTVRASDPGCTALDNPSQPRGRVATIAVSVDRISASGTSVTAGQSATLAVDLEGSGPWTLKASSSDARTLEVKKASCPLSATTAACTVRLQGIDTGHARLALTATDGLGGTVKSTVPLNVSAAAAPSGNGSGGGGGSLGWISLALLLALAWRADAGPFIRSCRRRRPS